jgi:hypothetical protein
MTDIQDNDQVRTLHKTQTFDGATIPAGSEGVVIAVFEKPEPAFEVEFHVESADPEYQSVVLKPDQLELASKGA